MRLDLLNLLQCPFCAGALRLEPGAAYDERGEIATAVLGCDCSAYPVVDEIPCLLAGDGTAAGVRLVREGRHDEALLALLEVTPAHRPAVEAWVRGTTELTFRDALVVFKPDDEAAYLRYRFSDPTYVASSALLGALGQEPQCWTGRVLDVGGGTGHLTRTLTALPAGREVVLLARLLLRLVPLRVVEAAARCRVDARRRRRRHRRALAPA